MRQAKKGEQYYFGMKAHIGADADSGLVHSVHVTAANESDVADTHALLHGQERRVHADTNYTGAAKREDIVRAQAEGRVRGDIHCLIAGNRGAIVAMANGAHKRLPLRNNLEPGSLLDSCVSLLRFLPLKPPVPLPSSSSPSLGTKLLWPAQA